MKKHDSPASGEESSHLFSRGVSYRVRQRHLANFQSDGTRSVPGEQTPERYVVPYFSRKKKSKLFLALKSQEDTRCAAKDSQPALKA